MENDIKKSRHCILYHTNFGRNDGSPLYYFNAMKNLGLDVTHLKPEGDISNFGKFDYYWWIDYGEDGLPVDKEWKIPEGKSIYVASDTHLGPEYRFKKAESFDFVFFNQKAAISGYQIHCLSRYLPINKTSDTAIVWKDLDRGQIVGWLPHAAEPMAYPKTDILKKWDVCFIGHQQNTINHNGFTRTDALDRLLREFPNFYYGSRHPAFPEKNLFEDAALKYCQSKIVFNISIKDDVNMRVFETLSTGSFLLTNNIPTLGELFKDGEDLVTYSTLDEMVEKARYYLEHDEERERIAEAGYKKFISAHTYTHRIQKILEVVV